AGGGVRRVRRGSHAVVTAPGPARLPRLRRTRRTSAAALGGTLRLDPIRVRQRRREGDHARPGAERDAADPRPLGVVRLALPRRARRRRSGLRAIGTGPRPLPGTGCRGPGRLTRRLAPAVARPVAGHRWRRAAGSAGRPPGAGRSGARPPRCGARTPARGHRSGSEADRAVPREAPRRHAVPGDRPIVRHWLTAPLPRPPQTEISLA